MLIIVGGSGRNDQERPGCSWPFRPTGSRSPVGAQRPHQARPCVPNRWSPPGVRSA